MTTTIGFGSSKQGTAGVHGAPLGHADLAAVKASYGFDKDAYFKVPADVAAPTASSREIGRRPSTPSGGKLFARSTGRRTPSWPPSLSAARGRAARNWRDALPKWTPEDKALATRQSSQLVLNKLAEAIPDLVGGSADLTPSNLTKFRGALDFQMATPEGRYVRFGVREHAMAAICNGLAAYSKGLIPFCATFLNFFGYAAGAVRVSALSDHGVIYVATHDSIGLGEDGPTHQPVEALIHFRAMPNILTLRPADANEVSGSYMVALEHRKTPSIIALSRQSCPNLKGTTPTRCAAARTCCRRRPTRQADAARPRRHRLGGAPPRQRRREAARGFEHSDRVNAVLGALRRANRGVPERGLPSRRAGACGRGPLCRGLVEVRALCCWYDDLWRVGPWQGACGALRLHRR